MHSTWWSPVNQHDWMKKIPEIMVSPTRIQILNKLSSYEKGMSANEISLQLSDFLGVRRHLATLLQQNVIEQIDGNVYRLTEEGKAIHKYMQEIASKVQEKKI